MARLVLVGLPGTGKTTLALELAERWHIEAVDTDDLLVARTGRSVADLLRQDGEATFRRLEGDALDDAIRGDVVVATGGGIVTLPASRDTLAKATTMWLDCHDDVIVQRVQGGDRPLLGDEPSEAIANLRAMRTRWYEEVSRVRIESSGTLHDVADQIEQAMKRVSW